MRHLIRSIRTTAALALLSASLLPACDASNRSLPEPPLRPLLFTESDQQSAFDTEGWELWTTPGFDPHAFPGLALEQQRDRQLDDAFDLRSPEGLIRSAYLAATRGDLATLQSLALDEQGLIDIARVPTARSAERHQNLQRSLEEFMRHFRPESATDARHDGLSGLIQPTGIQLGPPRRIDGSIVDTRENAEMYSANTMRIHVLSSSIDFDIRFPRLLKDQDGQWRISEAPSVSDTWQAFRRPGLDLKPELLDAEHAPFPFDVGNYWHYELKQLPLDGTGNSDDIAPMRALAYRDTVSEVFSGGIYHVVTLRRTFADPARNPETRNLLVTSRHIYSCSLECYRRRENLSFLLGYMGRNTPLFVFPANRNQGWREGGRTGGRTLRIAELSNVPIIVPAGSFGSSVHIRQADGGTGASIYFAEGIGILREEQRHGAQLHQANLVQYRILR